MTESSIHIAFNVAGHDIELGLVALPRPRPPETTHIECGTVAKDEQDEGVQDTRHPPNDALRPSQTITVAKSTSRRGEIKLVTDTRPQLLNNLLFSVGFLDLASACDFAANVWNDYPVPFYASLFMILGGLVALTTVCFALRDLSLSYANYLLLRSERAFLKQQRLSKVQRGLEVWALDAWLAVNFRELGGEVARLAMDAFMGSGVLLVGVGTWMALGGGDRRVFRASNLLSGYIGNTPIAFYGLLNSAWSIYLFWKTYLHSRAGREYLERRADGRSAVLGVGVGRLLERRTRLLRLYSALYGIAGFFTGVGSLISATMWFGYVISFPWIITSVFCNYLLRSRIGYDRPTIQDMNVGVWTKEGLIGEIEEASLFKSSLLSRVRLPGLGHSGSPRTPARQPLSAAISPLKTLLETTIFLVKYDLFSDFCLNITKNETLFLELFPDFPQTGTCTINSAALATVDGRFHGSLIYVASITVDQFGLRKFRQRERFLVEALGCFLSGGEGGG